MTASHDRLRHDLKNQLGIIVGFADLILDEMPPEDPRRPDVQEISAAARKAMELVATMFPSEDKA